MEWEDRKLLRRQWLVALRERKAATVGGAAANGFDGRWQVLGTSRAVSF